MYSTLCSEAEKVTSNNKSDAVKGMCCVVLVMGLVHFCTQFLTLCSLTKLSPPMFPYYIPYMISLLGIVTSTRLRAPQHFCLSNKAIQQANYVLILENTMVFCRTSMAGI